MRYQTSLNQSHIVYKYKLFNFAKHLHNHIHIHKPYYFLIQTLRGLASNYMKMNQVPMPKHWGQNKPIIYQCELASIA